ncbi:MAG: M18 family aminopeptidase, partial [Clostridia bacterium]
MLNELRSFLENSYTSYHTVENSAKILTDNGFVRLNFGEDWRNLSAGKYFVIFGASSVTAFVIGDTKNYSFNIAESHTDSPALKLKGNCLVESENYVRLNVEKYGGGILYSYLDRPLKVAGRLLVLEGEKVVSKIVTSNFFVTIPSLCIHHNPTVNEGFAFNVQTDMLPLLGEKNTDFISELSGGSKVLDYDLYATVGEKSYLSGTEGEFLVSPRIDNLTSVFCSIEALTKCSPKGIAIAVCYDNEEIGSGTKEGASSQFLPMLLNKINSALGHTTLQLQQALYNSFALSIDNGHAVHCAHPEKSDITNKVFMNKGVVIKHNVNYATDGESSAVFKKILIDSNLLYQDYYNRSDIRCGGTQGLLTSAQLATRVCDIGLAQLAMHSAVEMVGARDVET